MLKRIRSLPSPALVISAIALIIAVGGGSYAIASLNSGKVKKIAKKQANKQITKRAPGLSVAHASTADSATNADNASQLGGLAASAFTHSDCNSQTGQIKGFAKISASASFSSTFTTAGVFGYSCSGQAPEAMRSSQGEYEVRFPGNPATIAVGNANIDANQNPNVDLVAFKFVSGGDFKVAVYNPAGNPQFGAID